MNFPKIGSMDSVIKKHLLNNENLHVFYSGIKID